MGYGIDPANWPGRNRLRCQVATRWFKQRDIQVAPLQTWEVNRLIDNLQSLWNRLTSHVSITFSEPGLSFDATALSDEQYRGAIQPDHTLTPTWHPYAYFPLELTLHLNRLQLREASCDLTRHLSSYPER